MARQKLGPKKHARCEAIGGRKYHACLVRGGSPHFEALCIFYEESGLQSCDRVNYKEEWAEPETRDGVYIESPEELEGRRLQKQRVDKANELIAAIMEPYRPEICPHCGRGPTVLGGRVIAGGPGCCAPPQL